MGLSDVPKRVFQTEGVHCSGSDTGSAWTDPEDESGTHSDQDGVANGPTDDVPLYPEVEKISSLVHCLPPGGAHIAVVFMRGSFCPITRAHVMAFEEARNVLL